MLSAHRRSSKYQLNSLWFYSTWTRSHEEFEDTKGIIRICESNMNRQHNGQKKKHKRTNNDLQTYNTMAKRKSTKGQTTIYKRKHNGQKKKDKRTNNDLQNTQWPNKRTKDKANLQNIHKTKDRVHKLH